MTIREWLQTHFEKFEDSQVCGMEDWGNAEIASAYLVSSTPNALLQVTCGGDVIIGFRRPGRRGFPLYIIRDNEAGHAWEVEQRQARERLGDSSFHPSRPKPHARLRLVQTA